MFIIFEVIYLILGLYKYLKDEYIFKKYIFYICIIFNLLFSLKVKLKKKNINVVISS